MDVLVFVNSFTVTSSPDENCTIRSESAGPLIRQTVDPSERIALASDLGRNFGGTVRAMERFSQCHGKRNWSTVTHSLGSESRMDQASRFRRESDDYQDEKQSQDKLE